MSKQYYLILRDNFSSKAITDAGVCVTYTPVTRTLSNTYGSETLTTGTTSNITVYMVRKYANWKFDKEGEIEGGDALMLTLHTQSVSKKDRITYKGNDYEIKAVHKVSANGETVFNRCNLFLLE